MSERRNPDEAEDDMRTEDGRDDPAIASVRTVGTRDLLGPRGLLRIEHEGELYTLRVTRNNRLILTK